MKKILQALILFTFSCLILSCTNYYTVLLTEGTKVYSSSDSSNLITEIPKDTQVFLSSKSNKKNYKKIKWGNYSGWAYNPIYSSYNDYTKSTKTTNSSNYNYKSENVGSGGTVHVKGYYRSNGTYVKPHTRSSPSRRK
ncbi:hypothetical protein [Chryseobacterium oryctis]|uniref:SH3 domain-containing protein n=1 Tax=Chryseobacterium oryctis TaxID=2952618 RepID=A0ABT3HNP8_9FLAO|nr:hypothetical protein [Chryseobacterium oryctis]MCW3161406.1 hypothetical protein [Chryseobacterium oryctis]